MSGFYVNVFSGLKFVKILSKILTSQKFTQNVC